jgi:hypothetical protein
VSPFRSWYVARLSVLGPTETVILHRTAPAACHEFEILQISDNGVLASPCPRFSYWLHKSRIETTTDLSLLSAGLNSVGLLQALQQAKSSFNICGPLVSKFAATKYALQLICQKFLKWNTPDAFKIHFIRGSIRRDFLNCDHQSLDHDRYKK